MNNNNIIKPKMWRKRYIPNEIVDISSDEVLYRDEKLIVTRWNVIHPRLDFQKGISYIMLDDGFKISKFFRENGEYLKCYCDIIDVEYNPITDEYIFIDLLLDLVFISENETRILDSAELQEAIDTKLITKRQANISRKKLQKLISLIITNQFPPKQIAEKWNVFE